MDLLLKVFFESAGVAAAIPFSGETTFFAMRAFGGHDMREAAVAASLGSGFGVIAAFIFGRLLCAGYFLLYDKVNFKKWLSRDKYVYISQNFQKYFTVLFPLTWLPILSILTPLAGFIGARAGVALPLIIFGRAGYYFYSAFY